MTRKVIIFSGTDRFLIKPFTIVITPRFRPSEGGDSCNDGCTEKVTRIKSGSSISGNFTFLKTFSIQAASTGDSDVGTVIVRACGHVIATQDLYQGGSSAPGFNNYPSPAYNVPTAGDCTWSITASGGYVDVRAVTTTYRSAPPPTVDLQIDNSQGPVSLTAPAGFTLSWSSKNAAHCSASDNWSGAQSTSGSQVYSNVIEGTYTYTLTCENPSGSATDSVTAYVFSGLSVDVKVNNEDGPLSFLEPAAYSISWTSLNATACQAIGDLTDPIETAGVQDYAQVLQGIYSYTVRCSNPAGDQAEDTVQVMVNPSLPVVDLQINNEPGPLTVETPGSYTLTWTSQNASNCSASSTVDDWSGIIDLNGVREFSGAIVGTYSYSVTCENVSGSAIDSVTVYVVEPLRGIISASYSKLSLYSSKLGIPAQTLSGEVNGGNPPYSITVHVRKPSGDEQIFSRSGSTWSVTPENSGDPDFGTTEQGVWTAWADLVDSPGHSYRTVSVEWEVAWHPVHGLP